MATASQAHAETYNRRFWERREVIATKSANSCVPIIIDTFSPTSVVDVGCGRGHWLAVFRDHGVTDITGVDGPGVLENTTLLFPPDRFIEQDLSKPLQLSRSFDLALCLEVAEHLPVSSARTLVKSLTNLAATIVFSAAIPGQGGVGHCNEKWPWYWQNLFADHGYRQYDPFRHLFWHNQDIAVWYRQNMFVYANCQVGETCTALQPYDSAELTLIARDTLYRLSRPSLMERAFNRLRGAISEVVNR